MSIAAIFLEQVKINETIYQETHDDAFTDEILELESTLYEILCHIQSDLAQLNSYIKSHQSRGIMSEGIRKESGNLSRYIRDYIILKDVVEIFRLFLVSYTDIREVIQKAESSQND